MIRVVLLLASFITVFSTFAQNSDTSLITLENFKIVPGTYSWRDGNSFHNMTGWDSSPYTQGHLQQRSGSKWFFKMNYRLLFPKSYNADYESGYPLLIMFHGAGERGNCWDTNCYCTDCDPNKPEENRATAAYLNNDHMLAHGGQPFLNAVNLAGSKKMDDSSLNPKAFPGFVLFPQMENNWGNAESSNSSVAFALRILRFVVREHNINPDRIYIAGLSMGGQAVLKALSMADWLFAAAITMSPVPYSKSFDYEGAVNVPLWIFQGGLDQFPKPAHTEELIRIFRETGGSVRYTFYPDAGHNTWSRAFKEPEFFSWLLNRKKSDIFKYFETDYICATSDEGMKLSMPAGFPAYAWEVNGKIIDSEKEHILVAKEKASYRGRFSRVANPTNKDWNEWSDPLTLETYAPAAPKLKQVGTTFLPDLNENNEAVLLTEDINAYYFWEKNNAETSLPDSNKVFIPKGNCNSSCSNNGTYTLRVADYNGCKSSPSSLVTVFFSNQAPVVNDMRPESFTGEAISSSSIFLSWNDASGLERGYEIWRKNTSQNESKWELATITNRSVTFYYDTMLMPGSVYHYKIRAIGSSTRSDYFPSNNLNENLIVTLSPDNDIPFPPQNVKAELFDVNTVRVTWEPGKDESGIQEYIITYGDKVVKTGSSETTFILNGLDPNKNYPVTVQTLDISGNTSPPSNQYIVATKMTGLFYRHSTGAWNSLADPSIGDSWKNPEYTGHVEDLTLTPRVQEEYFNFEFNGFLDIDVAGEYTFYLNSDDGSHLFLNDELIIDYDGFHSTCKGSAESTSCPSGWGKPSNSLNLSRGNHRVKIRFFQYTGGKNIVLRYRGPDSGFSTIIVPAEAYSSGASPGQKNPAAPSDLAGKAVSMREIQLQWQASTTPESAYEVYRALKNSGPFEIINRVGSTSYADKNLVPGKTYYYRLRSVNQSGNSSFTPVISVKTNNDNEDPTAPASLFVESGNFSKAILRWEPSTDNVAIEGYQIWANDQLIGFSSVPAFEFSDMEQGQVYEFFVVAVDISGNKSAPSNRVTNEEFITATAPESYADFSFAAFPNPGPSRHLMLSISSGRAQEVTVRISDVLKKELFKNGIHLSQGISQVKLPVENYLPDGLYIIQVDTEGKIFKQKIIIRNE